MKNSFPPLACTIKSWMMSLSKRLELKTLGNFLAVGRHDVGTLASALFSALTRPWADSMAGHAEGFYVVTVVRLLLLLLFGSFWFIVSACTLNISPNNESTSVYIACTPTFCTLYTQTAKWVENDLLICSSSWWWWANTSMSQCTKQCHTTQKQAPNVKICT